jgi:RecA/RadA recombinase
MTKKTKKITEELSAPIPKETAIPKENMLSTGSTLVNLGCTGKTYGGLAKGFIFLFVGDSDSGKTWFWHTIMAEACKNPEFDDHQLVADLPEFGAAMDVASYFGQKLADRLEPVNGTKEAPEYSRTLEEFFDNLETRIKKGPCIYVIDSMDALEAEEDKEHREKKKAAKKAGQKSKGSYGTGKPKTNSQRLRPISNFLQDTGSILIIISQTRQNIGWLAMKNPKTRSGGDALTFYNRIELWLSTKQKITHKKHKDRELGSITKVRIKKNHISGWKGYVHVPFIHGFGVDDIGGSIDFLTENHWTVSGGNINASEFDFRGDKEELVKHIEENGKEAKLKKIVRQVWYDIEKKVKLQRKPRYE